MAELAHLREQLKDLQLYQTKAAITKCKRYYYEHNNKSGRALARSLRTRLTQSCIPEIKNKSGETVFIPEEMGEAFRQYYASLYDICNDIEKTDPDTFRQKIANYLDEVSLPRLPDQVLGNLELPISNDEFDQVLKDTPTGKAPGHDWYSLVYYRTFRDDQGKPWQQIPLGPTYHLSQSTGENYEPISLLNIDLKLFTKIFFFFNF